MVLFNPNKPRGWRDSPLPSPSCRSAGILLHLMAPQGQALWILLGLRTGAEHNPAGGELAGLYIQQDTAGEGSSGSFETGFQPRWPDTTWPLVADGSQAAASPSPGPGRGLVRHCSSSIPHVPSSPPHSSPPTSLRSSCIRQVLVLSRSHRE